METKKNPNNKSTFVIILLLSLSFLLNFVFIATIATSYGCRIDKIKRELIDIRAENERAERELRDMYIDKKDTVIVQVKLQNTPTINVNH